mgnify:CR=1 FL=1
MAVSCPGLKNVFWISYYMYINRDINEARITRTARINYFSFRVNPCNPCLIYISLRDFSVLFEVLVDGIYLFNDECHFVF